MLTLQFLLGLMLLEKPAAGPPFLTRADVVNRCRSPNVCDFVCDCWDCSDENQCGYQKNSVALGTPFTCDFEGSTCGWEDVSTTAYRWTPGQTSVLTWGAGAEPPFDHTLGTDLGWYLTTTKQRGKPSVTARLRSPTMREAAATCEIRAWYHLWGPGVNETHQTNFSLEMSHGNDTVTLWRNPLSCVNSWRELVAYTGRIRGMFQMTFSVTQAFSEVVQVALDDVEFRNCGFPPNADPPSCSPGEAPCQQGGCIAQDRRCDGTEDCKDGLDEASCESFSFCTFEDGWCDWVSEPKGLAWARKSSQQVPLSHARPTRDHSTNSRAGYFVFVTNGPLDLKGGKAWLVSPTLTSQTDLPCYLVFYVHLHDSTANSLNIYYRTAGDAMQLARSRSGDLGDYWFREKVDFNVTGEFQIVIEGIIGMGHKGNVALDDLILSPGCKRGADPFPVFPESETPNRCSPEEFACENSTQCISAGLVCNFEIECEDGSDERHCGTATSASGMGGWTDISVGRMQWAARRRSTQLDSALRSAVEDSFGLREAPGQMLSLARAATPVLGPSGLACALEMNFTTGPRGLVALAVADESRGTSQWLWHALGNGTSAWERSTVPLGARERPFQLELLALEDLRGVEESFLGVRSISLVDCEASASLALPPGLSCNFETDWCAWFTDQRDGFEWERSTSQGWAVDHTTGSGSFLSVNPTVPGSRGLSARLVSAFQSPAGNASCLSFWYRMDGPQIGTLNLKVKRAGDPEEVLWTRTGSHGAVWHQASSTIAHRPGQNYQIVFESLRNGFLGSMALDDIAVTPGVCAAQKSCSFEIDECGLLGSKPGLWVRRNGTAGQGPLTDHTLGTPAGQYMIVDTGAKAQASGQTATLRSPSFLPRLHTHCVTFWYHLNSCNPGSLHVYVEQDGEQRESLDLKAVQGDVWHYGSFGAKVQREWQVVFVAEDATEGSSYVAVDDFCVEEGDCPKSGSCDFESGTCGWSKPHGEWYSWDWKQGATPSQSPSPRKDHTLGTEAGHYAYVDIAVLGMGRNTARLASEPLPATTGSCLQIHYHMNFLGQSSQAELKVLLSSSLGERKVWSAVGHQGRAWKNQTFFVMSPAEFQIVLEASSGAWPNSETIAVDDVWYAAGTGCNSTPGGPEEGGSGSSGKGSGVGLAAGIICSVILVLVAAGISVYCLKKRSVPRDRMLEDSAGNIQGFDNITFRDDRITIPPLPVGEEGE